MKLPGEIIYLRGMLQFKDNFKMRIKFYTVSCLLVFITSNIYGQQIFEVNPFLQPDYLINPAAAGSNEILSVGIIQRKMWKGIDGGPETTVLFADNYYSKFKTGVGVTLYNDITGPTQRSGGEIGLSYSLKFSDRKKLMFGLSGQALQEKIDFTDLAKYIPGDPLLAGNSSVFSGDASAGIYFVSKLLKLGVSAKQLIHSKLKFINENGITSQLYSHYYFVGSYNIITDEENIITPNVLIKFASNTPADIEVGAKIENRDFISCGLSIHYKQDFIAYVGLKIKHKFSIGYAFEQYKTPLSTFDGGSGSNEIMLKYAFTKK